MSNGELYVRMFVVFFIRGKKVIDDNDVNGLFLITNQYIGEYETTPNMIDFEKRKACVIIQTQRNS